MKVFYSFYPLQESQITTRGLVLISAVLGGCTVSKSQPPEAPVWRLPLKAQFPFPISTMTNRLWARGVLPFAPMLTTDDSKAMVIRKSWNDKESAQCGLPILRGNCTAYFLATA